jgi:NMD protein affecting ribosome stability and mRNA decay
VKHTRRACAGCYRAHGEPRTRDGVTVQICDECNADWFRRERVFATARGEAWDAAKTGRPRE